MFKIFLDEFFLSYLYSVLLLLENTKEQNASWMLTINWYVHCYYWYTDTCTLMYKTKNLKYQIRKSNKMKERKESTHWLIVFV